MVQRIFPGNFHTALGHQPVLSGHKKAMGDARKEKVADVLKRVSTSAVFQKIDKGDPLSMGESVGVSKEYAKKEPQS